MCHYYSSSATMQLSQTLPNCIQAIGNIILELKDSYMI